MAERPVTMACGSAVPHGRHPWATASAVQCPGYPPAATPQPPRVLVYVYRVRVVQADPEADPREDANVERVEPAMAEVAKLPGVTIDLVDIEEG
jgi:hypothetical protein